MGPAFSSKTYCDNKAPLQLFPSAVYTSSFQKRYITSLHESYYSFLALALKARYSPTLERKILLRTLYFISDLTGKKIQSCETVNFSI